MAARKGPAGKIEMVHRLRCDILAQRLVEICRVCKRSEKQLISSAETEIPFAIMISVIQRHLTFRQSEINMPQPVEVYSE